MLNTSEFGNELKKLGFNFYSGVPCSFLKNLINYSINECEYIAAANEGDAVAIASGAYLGGRKSVVLMQNSGLTNCTSPLTSLNYPFQIPILGFVSLRGEPGLNDEPQHELMGQITTQLLDLMQIKWQFLSFDDSEAKRQLEEANKWIEANRPFFFVVRKETFKSEKLKIEQRLNHKNKEKSEQTDLDALPSRFDTLKVINGLKDMKTVLIATTGKTGRELYEVEDSDNNLYMVGSMGCVGSLGLGLAYTRKDIDVIVIDGDGSLLMRMGSLSTNGYYQPENMLHILLDNQVHDSTGGQNTVSHNVDFVNIAAACGYEKSCYIHSLHELEKCIQEWKMAKGLTFIYLKISKGSKQNLGRPKVTPSEVKTRLQRFLK
ncbi:phosphonopyruvate decarboxylase [Lysinibacillus sp. KCTC 33748]|uniref:phosphonopyruvate decarboxylase n=1 Tax=unclassified Lysinibacillus TaxID=2636778 RepID=UPI0009A651B3|nr:MULTISPECIES: phosphonopyruvate decarboxylase [unclassified Lysinibacillus]OXS72627.1 phosphonopyruvate decarboxylase [Lysinibacillus sp. KCTC 33748]SKB91893.1 phosphonopyruvate decarboxylase [Lysinibacillus sp. AC-3]